MSQTRNISAPSWMGFYSVTGIPPSITCKFAGSHLYSWVERGTVRVKCRAQEHYTMSLARARTQTARPRNECTNCEFAVPPIVLELLHVIDPKKYTDLTGF